MAITTAVRRGLLINERPMHAWAFRLLGAFIEKGRQVYSRVINTC